MVFEHRTDYSKGYVVEYLHSNTSKRCDEFILIPAENLWNEGVRGFLYLLAMLYLFLGIAIASDIFMNSIEVMTSKKRSIVKLDPERGPVTIEVLVWNETVANLTLMALGSSAPEIMLAVIEQAVLLGQEQGDSLGVFTIIGSAAFNLFIISSICIITVPSPDVKFIKEFGVFLTTTFYSIFAYVWMLLVVQYISPGEIEPWEAWVTVGYMPVFVLHSYAQDSGWWFYKCKSKTSVSDQTQPRIRNDDRPAIRVFTHQARKGSITGHAVPGQELHMLEAAHRNKTHQLSDLTDTESIDDRHATHRHTETKVFARARFRHAVVSAMTGHKAPRRPNSGKTHMADVVSAVQGINDVVKKGLMPNLDDLYGKFTFSSSVYEVLESKGVLEIDVLFHRKLPVNNPGTGIQMMNGQSMMINETAADPKFKEVSVEYETREGSAKAGSKFKYINGTLHFKETDYKKSISIPIIQDNQYTGNADFLVILKNPGNGAGLGFPSASRVNIVDDDAPGEFQFSDSHVFAKDGKISVKIIRERGYDGKVSLEYSTHDVTAVGGESIKEHDYVSIDHSIIEFKNQEKSKNIDIKINKEAKFEDGQGSKSFIVTIKNPSIGAKIGKTATIVCHINKESLDDRIADVVADMEEEEDVTWGAQFFNAFSIGGEKDEDGHDVKPKWHEYLLHFLTFFWKIVGACIPPTKYLGAWPAFVLSLLYIGVLTLFIQQLATLLGCVIGIETSVSGITLIALGTSLPDTFASRTAAKQDEHADAAIGNITGSNSVNVFLGLGLPWVLATMYGVATDKPYKVATGNLTVSVIIFCVLAAICIFVLIMRRKFVGGELGGKNACIKWMTSFLLFSLWIVYIVLSSLRAYNIITW